MRMRTVVVVLAVVVGVLAGMVGCSTDDDGTSGGGGNGGVETNSGNDDNPPPDDVELTLCGPDGATGWVRAGGLITNHSSKASTYFVNVEFVAGGVRYAEGVFSSSTVAAGQMVEWDASGLTDSREGTTCKITSVERFAS